jgi:hypothetical protein
MMRRSEHVSVVPGIPPFRATEKTLCITDPQLQRLLWWDPTPVGEMTDLGTLQPGSSSGDFAGDWGATLRPLGQRCGD